MIKKAPKTAKKQPQPPKRGRGKPKLDASSPTVNIVVGMTAALLAQIDAAAGPGRRAAFIRAAVEHELGRAGRRPS